MATAPENPFLPEPQPGNLVFISYSRNDGRWLKELEVQLRPFKLNGLLRPWDDRQIEAGAEWNEEIDQQLNSARVAVLLVTANFLGSSFIMKHELPRILLAREKRRLVVIWLLVGACNWELSPLQTINAAHDMRVPLEAQKAADRNAVMASVAKQIYAAVMAAPASPEQFHSAGIGPNTDFALLNDLRQLTSLEFETLVFELDLSDILLNVHSLDGRIQTLVNSRWNVSAIRQKMLELKRRGRLTAKLQNWLLDVFSLVSGRLYRRLLQQGLLPRTSDANLLSQYMQYFSTEMSKGNTESLQYVPNAAAEIEGDSLDSNRIDPKGAEQWNVRRIRQVLRLLSGSSQGGDQATAQLAALDRSSRAVRNAVRILMRSSSPLILLGDPGTGKSMAMREVGGRIVLQQMERRYPKVPVYIQLGLYNTFQNDGEPEDILPFLFRSLPSQYAKLLPKLLAERRLIVLFDGMDEMERRFYGKRVARLSKFGSDNEGSVKTLFACRINDFSPEFTHNQLVLLPFDKRQITEFVRANVNSSLTINGIQYDARSFVKPCWRRAPSHNSRSTHCCCI